MTSVAARFDTTPGELTSLNKLNTSFIFPGQSLLVPDKTASSGENISDAASSDATAHGGSPTEKTRKLSTEEVQQEEKERGREINLTPLTFLMEFHELSNASYCCDDCKIKIVMRSILRYVQPIQKFTVKVQHFCSTKFDLEKIDSDKICN